MRARFFWLGAAVLFALEAGIGFYAVAHQAPIVLARDVLVFETTENVVDAALALACAALAFVPARASLVGARVAGVVLLALAALGFVSGRLFGLSDFVGYHLELAENAFHLGLGVWATLVGYEMRKKGS